MEATYKAYRNMKRSIRSDAARDIQRYFRGYVARKRFKHRRISSPGSVPMETALPAEFEYSHESDDDRFARYYQDTNLRSADTDTYSDEDAVMEKSMGTLASEFGGVGLQSLESDALKLRMKSLFSMKKDMKDKLRLFEEEFFKTRGSYPSKKDRQVMKPFYDQYNEVGMAEGLFILQNITFIGES